MAIITTYEDIYLITSDGVHAIASEITAEDGFVQTAIYPLDPREPLDYIDVFNPNDYPSSYEHVAAEHREAIMKYCSQKPMDSRDLTE